MKRLLLVFCFLVVVSQNEGSAQEVIPVYSDYLTDNLYLLHPSMAGASNMNKLRMTARQQWFDVENAPSLQTASIHARTGEKIGVGGIAFNDQNGNFSRRGIYGTFAYHLLFSRSELDLNQLSFGISGGFIQHSLDQRGFSGYDPLAGDRYASAFYGNVDVGMSYYYFDFFAHLTGKNILAVPREVFFREGVLNQRKYLFSTGYVINTYYSSWSYEPSILFQLTEETGDKSVDLNLKIYRDLEQGGLFGGMSYRTGLQGTVYSLDNQTAVQYSQYLTPFVGFEYNNLLFAYTYSQQFNEIVMSTQGFHQISLGWNFGEDRARYDCVCPAVNQKRRR